MKKGIPSLAIYIALVVFLIFCIVTVFKLKIDLDSRQKVYDDLKVKISNYQNYVNELENILESEYGEEYVKEIAKDKLNLADPDEIIFYNDIAG